MHRKLYVCNHCGEVTSKLDEIKGIRHQCPFCGSPSLRDYDYDNEFLTVKEFAERMKMSESGVYTMISQGRIPCHRIYSRIRLRISDFKEEDTLNEYGNSDRQNL